MEDAGVFQEIWTVGIIGALLHTVWTAVLQLILIQQVQLRQNSYIKKAIFINEMAFLFLKLNTGLLKGNSYLVFGAIGSYNSNRWFFAIFA